MSDVSSSGRGAPRLAFKDTASQQARISTMEETESINRNLKFASTASFQSGFSIFCEFVITPEL